MCTIEKLQKHLALSIRSNRDILTDLLSDDPDVVNETIKTFIPNLQINENSIDKICLNLLRFVCNVDVNALKMNLEEIFDEAEIDNKIKDMKVAFMEILITFETENVMSKLKNFQRENGDKNDTELIFLLFNNVLSQNDGNLFRTTIKPFLPEMQADNLVIKKIRKSLLSALNQNITQLKLSLSEFIFVFVANEKNLDLATSSEKFTCHPVFCITRNDGLAFVDEYGLEYQNWQKYKTENLLPSGAMVIPKTGAYIFDENEEVLLEVSETPASRQMHRVIDVHHIFEQNRTILMQLSFAEDSSTLLREKIQDIFGYKVEDVRQEDIEKVAVNLIRYVFLSNYESALSDCLNPYFLQSEIEIKMNEIRRELLSFLFEIENGDDLKGSMKNIVMQYDRGEKTEPELHLALINLLSANNGVRFMDYIKEMMPSNKRDAQIEERCNNIVNQALQCFQENYYLNNFGLDFNDIRLVLVCNDQVTKSALASQNFTWHLISGISFNESSIFIDNNRLLYSSWQNFLKSKMTTSGTIIAPRNGEYNYDENCRVLLDLHFTTVNIQNLSSNRNNRQRDVLDVQQNFADNSGFGTEIIWDFLGEREETVLKEKIEHLIPGSGLSTKEIDDLIIASIHSLYWYNGCFLPGKISQLVTKKENEIREIEKKIKLAVKNFLEQNPLLHLQLNNWRLFFTHDDSQIRVFLFEILFESFNCDGLRKSIKAVLPKTKGQKAIEEMRQTLFNSVWQQRKYTNRQSLTSIIYVLVTENNGTFSQLAIYSTKFSCHPVFRTRKCLSNNPHSNNSSLNCCMIYIDECGRVYKNWKSYLAENVLPSGIMIAPKNGYYTFDTRNRVQLDILRTPANSDASQLLSAADTTAAWTGFAAAAVPIAALLSLPVAAPVLAVAGVTGLVTGAYGAARSGYNLYDRNNHEQSISLDNRQARGSWLGVAGGVIGVGASGATKAMTSAAAMGSEVSMARELFVNGMNITSIMISGSGVANGVLDIYLKLDDNEEISSFELLQLSASLVLFTHSVNNFRFASSIVSDTRNGTIQQYREGLSNRQRKIYNKMVKETIRIKGETQGKIDVIRTTNEIPNKQYLNDLYKINKKLNQAKVRPAFGGRGEGVVLNNEMPINTQELRNSVQHNQGPNILGSVTQPIPESHTTASQARSVSSIHQVQFINENRSTNSWLSSETFNYLLFKGAIIILPNGSKFDFGKFCRKFCSEFFTKISNGESFRNVICAMATNYTENALRFLLELANEMITTIITDIQARLGMFISTESVLYRILEYCLKHYTSRCHEFLRQQAENIRAAVRNHFLSLNPNSSGTRYSCTECNGYYTTCEV